MTLAPIMEPDAAQTTDLPDSSDDFPVLFRRLAELDVNDPDRPALREQLIVVHLPLAHNLARRFSRRGEAADDLIQVARIGLVKSVDRFDPTRGIAFLAFAVPTITGELRRHFRDHAWYIRPPRALQELHLQLNAAALDLLHRDRRAPTTSALARHLGVTVADIHEGLQLSSAYTPMRLDAPIAAGGEDTALVDSLGEDDGALETVEHHETLKRLIAALTERERRMLALRFVGEYTQRQIALEIGVSQMQVSRLLSATLARRRSQLLADD